MNQIDEQRDLGEVLASQEKMLERLGRSAAPREEMKRAFSLHLEKLHAWLGQQKNIEVLYVSYNELIEQPEQQAHRVAVFLGGRANVENMAKAVDQELYRNKKS